MDLIAEISTDYKDTFALRLKELRDYARLTQSELAEYLGVSRGSISYYENRERVADIEFLGKAAAFFGVDAAYLLGESNTLSKPNREAGLTFGFSDLAIEKLLIINDCHLGEPDILNRLIESDNFEKFLDALSGYCNGHFDEGTVRYFDAGYVDFILANAIINMFLEIRKKYADDIKAYELEMKIDDKIKEGLSRDNAIFKIIEEIDNRYNEHRAHFEKWQTDCKKDIEAYKATDPQFKIRSIVHEKINSAQEVKKAKDDVNANSNKTKK